MPLKKAEPFKRWLAQVGAERIHQMQDPELGIQQLLMDYKRLGYSDNWINQRLKSIEIRKDLTDQWKAHHVKEGVGYATLTDIIYQAWAGLTFKNALWSSRVKDPNIQGQRIGDIRRDWKPICIIAFTDKFDFVIVLRIS